MHEKVKKKSGRKVLLADLSSALVIAIGAVLASALTAGASLFVVGFRKDDIAFFAIVEVFRIQWSCIA